MKPRISVITLGVDDLEKAVAFYRDGLGLATKGIIGRELEHGAVAFFDLQPGLKLAVWPRASVAHDTGLPRTPAAPTDFTLGHNVDSKEEVDAVMSQAVNAGAIVLKAAHPTFWEAMRVIFKIPTSMCGRWFGIPISRISEEKECA